MKTKHYFLLLSMLVCFSLTSMAAGNTYYVTADGSPTADGLSWETATTFDNAISLLTGTSTSYDAIFVKTGTYNAPSTNGLGYYFNTKYVKIYGNCVGTESPSNLPEYTDATSIQTFINAPSDGSGGYLGRSLTLYKGNVSFYGFDIFGGDATKAANVGSPTPSGQNYGGVVYNSAGLGQLGYCKIHGGVATQGAGVWVVIYGSATSLDHCEIYGNSSSSMGGGVYAGAYVAIKNCIVRDNTGSSGGGIYSNDTNPGGSATISNCIIKNNTGTSGYGGIFNKSGVMVNCLVIGNTGSVNAGGVGLNIQGTYSAKLINSTIVNNKTVSNNSSDAGGVVIGAGTVKNCIIWGNTKNNGATNQDIYAAGNNASQANASTITYSCYNVMSINNSFTYQIVNSNNLAAGTDPLFTNAGLNDFTLTDASPCHDAGDIAAYDGTYPTVDLNNNNRTVSTIDFGAYEYPTSKATGFSNNTIQNSNLVLTNKGSLTVKCAGNIRIYNVNGMMIYKNEILKATEFSLPSGIYFVNISGVSIKTVVN